MKILYKAKCLYMRLYTRFIKKEKPAEPEELTASDSLLDNVPYISLAKQCCQMYEELDRITKQVTNSEILDFISMQKSRIKESLILSGASMVGEETEFDLLRHKNVSKGIVKNGTPIENTIETGIAIENRVMIKAKVVCRHEEQ